jgi:HEAT repeat protein
MKQVGKPLPKGKTGSTAGWLRWLNLRPEESERTFLMFAFYTLSSVGILWLEVSVAALFLGEYGAASLPWIYIASAVIGTGFGVCYAWLQRLLPLRRVIVGTAVLMALPLLLLRLPLNPAFLGGYTVFLMRLWLEAIYVINELNTSITANQLFTIREIKRTYPLISSGILAADVLSGLSLPVLRQWIGLPNVIALAGVMLLGGAAVLLYLTQIYHPFFPDGVQRHSPDKPNPFAKRTLQGRLRRYTLLVVGFFVLLQVLALLLDFQYLSQLEQTISADAIADFLALFSASLGIVELLIQWFISGRAIERVGVFRLALLPPASTLLLSSLTLTGLVTLFLGTSALKFIDELLRYTVIASIAPILFQPLPESERTAVQSDVRGIAEPVSTGLTGLALLLVLWLPASAHRPASVFLVVTATLALLWLLIVKQLQAQYVEVLVLSADQGQLSLSQVDVQGFRREIEDAITRSDQAVDREAYIELLIRTDPKRAGERLAPRLLTLPPALQRQSLEVMLHHPQPAYLDAVQALVQQLQESGTAPEVLAAALRYSYLTQPERDLTALRSYLKPAIHPVVRSTAAALMLRCGTAYQKAEATNVLRRMLTHPQEGERVMGCRALGEADYLQALRLYVQPLLRDSSVRVRCAVLEAIAATHLEEHYPSLLRGLYYKTTRAAAQRALVRLENEALPLLLTLAENLYQPEGIRSHAWSTIGQIGTPEAIEVLVTRLLTTWGNNRRMLLRVLLKLPQEAGIDGVADHLGRRGIETLMTQEFQFLAHVYAGLQDLGDEPIRLAAADLLRRALQGAETDAIERLFLLMQFLYDPPKIRAAAFNLKSASPENRARGLEILDNTLDLAQKRAVLILLDTVSSAEKLQALSGFVPYHPLSLHRRLHSLIELRHFLPDWVIACCFHLARQTRCRLTLEQTFAGLRSPTGYVREAALAYLQAASPSSLRRVLPTLEADPDPLVRTQVHHLMAALGLEPSTALPSPSRPRTKIVPPEPDSTDLELIE